MNAPSIPTATAEPTDIDVAGSIEQRQSSLMDELRAEPSQPAGEAEEDGESRPAAAAPAVASPADSDADTRRADRQKRLEAFKLQERAAVDHKERQAYADKQTARARDAEEKLAAMSQGTFDRAVLKDPIAIMKMMEDAGVGADQVAEAIRDSIANPNVAASRAARAAVTPEIAQLREQLAAQNAQIASLIERDAKAQAANTERQHTEQFVGHVEAQAARAPLSAALLRHDRAEFLSLANMAADRVPGGAGPDALLDAMEEFLDGDVRAVANKYSAIYGPQTTPSRATQPRPGAVQPNTVSNSLAQERGSIVDEEDFSRLPVEERARRLIRSM